MRKLLLIATPIIIICSLFILLTASPVQAGILWDQPVLDIPVIYENQDFDSLWDDWDEYVADDLINTNSWTFNKIFVPGDFKVGQGTTLFNATALHWDIYQDNGSNRPNGYPGDGATSTPFWSLSASPTDSRVTIDLNTSVKFANTTLDLASPINLPPGHWWLVFYPEMDSYDTTVTGGKYIRKFSSTSNIAVGRVVNPGGGQGLSYPGWNIADYDIAFRIEDTIPPTTGATVTPASPDGDNGWYKTTPQIRLTPDETAAVYYQWDSTSSGGWVGDSVYDDYVDVPVPDGQRVLYFRSIDTADNTEAAKSTPTYKVDAVKPSGSVAIDGGAAYATSTTVSLSFNATDSASGVAQMRFAESTAALSAAGYIAYASTDTITLAGGDGMKIVYAQYKDNAGNESEVASDTIILDRAAPSAGVTIDSDAVYTNSASVTLNLNSDDAGGSGVAQMRFAESTASLSAAGYIAYAATDTAVLTGGDGTKTVYVQYKDAAGNESEVASDTIILDTGIPDDPSNVISTNQTTGTPTTGNIIDIAFSGATDTLSGIAGYAVSWSQDATALPDAAINLISTGAATETTSKTLSNGTWFFNLRTQDNAGNWTSTVHLGPFLVQCVPPITTANTALAADGDNGWYKTDPAITFSADETATTYFSWDSTASMTTYTPPAPIASSTGEHRLYYFSIDTWGNTETTKYNDFKIDTTAPSNPALSSPSHGTGLWSNDNTIDINLVGAADSVSGVDGFSYSFSQASGEEPDQVKDIEESAASFSTSPLADGTWYAHVRTKDNAGNWSSAVQGGSYSIDTAKPTGTISINSGAAETKSKAVTLSLTSADGAGSGVAQMRFSTDGSSWSVWEANASTKGWTLSSGDGVKSVYVQYLDGAGNISASANDQITLKTSPPRTRLSLKIKRKRIQVGKVIILTGKLKDAAGHGIGRKKIKIKIRKKTIKSFRTKRRGAYRVKIKIKKRGTFKLRAVFKGGRRLKASASKSVKIKVRKRR